MQVLGAPVCEPDRHCPDRGLPGQLSSVRRTPEIHR